MINIARARDGGPNSLLQGLDNLDVPLFVIDPDPHTITWNDILRRLNCDTIELHVARFACFGRSGASLDNADSPHPSVYSNGFHPWPSIRRGG